MKGGVVLALGVARALAARPAAFAELAVLLVTDEEWRTTQFAHVRALRRLRRLPVLRGRRARPARARRAWSCAARRPARCASPPTGRASHSGSAPDQGRNALLALAAGGDLGWPSATTRGDPSSSASCRPCMRSGEALQRRAGRGRADLRHARRPARGVRRRARPRCPAELDGVDARARMERVWPGMDSTDADRPACCKAPARGSAARSSACRRGGASDASHFAATIPLTVDGLGPARRRRAHARGVRARAVAARARRGGAGGGARPCSRLVPGRRLRSCAAMRNASAGQPARQEQREGLRSARWRSSR